MRCHGLVPLLTFALVALPALSEDSPAVQKAKAAASAWLALTDGGQFDQSWDQAAAYFRSAIPKAQWKSMIDGVRTPLGRVETRTLKSTASTHSLPNAPEGEYVVIQFETRFQNRPSATETIVSMLDKDQSWRVSGYFIQ